MKYLTTLALLSFCLDLTPLQARPDETNPDHLILSDDFVVSGVFNQQEIKLLVDPAVYDRPILNPQFVGRHGIKPSLLTGNANIGPVKLKTRTKVLKYLFHGHKWKRRSLWTNRRYTKQYDGAVGVGGIPHRRITFRLRQSRPDEQLFIFPMVENGSAGTEMAVGDIKIFVTFTNRRRATLATAAAGAEIAEAYGGKFVGAPEKLNIAYGIERPIRRLELKEKLSIAGLKLDKIFVRTKDWGDASNIAEQIDDEDTDSSEIVVVGRKNRKEKQLYFITLGRDDLSHCSSITFDKIDKQISLRCRGV